MWRVRWGNEVAARKETWRNELQVLIILRLTPNEFLLESVKVPVGSRISALILGHSGHLRPPTTGKRCCPRQTNGEEHKEPPRPERSGHKFSHNSTILLDRNPQSLGGIKDY